MKEIYLDKNDKKIIYALKDNELPIMELSRKVNIAHKNVLPHLKKLEAAGFISRHNYFGRVYHIRLNKEKFVSYLKKELESRGISSIKGIFSNDIWDDFIYNQPNHQVILNEMPLGIRENLVILIATCSENYKVIVELTDYRKEQLSIKYPNQYGKIKKVNL